MIIYRIRHEEYNWVMFDSSINNRQHYIWIKNNNTFQKIIVNEFNLFGYLKNETLKCLNVLKYDKVNNLKSLGNSKS
jgi:hypothetical protein